MHTIRQLSSSTVRAGALLAGLWLTSTPAPAQTRGRQAVPTKPTAAPTGQPAPLAPAKLEEALRMLLKADSVATLKGRKLGGAESQGLVLDQALTKLGHDFYDQFYSTFEAPMGVVDYNIVVAERPARGNSALVVLTVNDTELLELPLPTRADQMEEIVSAAVESAQEFLQEALNTSRQLEQGHRLPPEQY
ncbi:curli production assembly/transport protein CsgE [Hymenobacter sp. DH14]|uniref:Curli production assembly/transport component CsgE n=1 Tax=Hymenobacter cyanobacteriorum TaxID=2926463 RepID=A0A9X1VH26_9BACT|nr:curli production assembly/transport protein CsgE [Hymenobacter cyanobacteriorum]